MSANSTPTSQVDQGVRPPTPIGQYARSLGITTYQLRKLGGMERCMKMSAEARALIMPKKRHS